MSFGRWASGPRQLSLERTQLLLTGRHGNRMRVSRDESVAQVPWDDLEPDVPHALTRHAIMEPDRRSVRGGRPLNRDGTVAKSAK